MFVSLFCCFVRSLFLEFSLLNYLFSKMLRMPSFGRKKLQTATSLTLEASMDVMSPKAVDSPRPVYKLEKTDSGKLSPPRHNLITRLTRRASFSKSRRTKSDSIVEQVRSNGRTFFSLETELELAFNVFDVNRDGKISASELGAVLRSLGDEVSEQELELIMKDVDRDRDGYISLREFIDVHKSATHVANEKSPREEDFIRAAFDTFDKDGNNLISPDELQAVLRSLGDKSHTIDDCRRMISNVDQDGDGFVDYREFKLLMGAR